MMHHPRGSLGNELGNGGRREKVKEKEREREREREREKGRGNRKFGECLRLSRVSSAKESYTTVVKRRKNAER